MNFCHAVFPAIAERRLLNDYFGGKTGIFVDVGGNSPANSVSTDLEIAGWTGIVVEPQPDCAANLRAERSCPIIEAACVAAAAEGDTVTLYLAGEQSSLWNEFIFPTTPRVGEIRVKALTLNQIFHEHAISTIDLLSLDTEGTEIDVMNGLDWALFAPRLVLLEDHGLDEHKHRYMVARGYVRFRRTGFNSWYAKERDVLPISVLGRFEILRKYYLSRPFRRFRRWKLSIFRTLNT